MRHAGTGAYKTELDLTDRQVTACRQYAGAARWAYNWGLQVKQERYRATRRAPPPSTLHRELNALKKTDVPWMYQVSKCAPQEALWNLDAAFQHFFRRCTLKKQGKWEGKLGYPQFKTKKKGLGSFRLTGRIVVSEKAIVLPRLGRLRLKERDICRPEGCADPLGHGERAGGALVCESAGRRGAGGPREYGTRGGDRSRGEDLATLSDGEVIPNPRHLKRRLKKLKRLQRVVSRRQKGGKNRKKAVRKLAKLHRQIKNQRRNTLHQVTTRLAKTKSVLVIEDLQRQRDAEEPPSGASHRRCGLLRVQAAAALQSQLVWGAGDPGGSVGALQQAVQWMWVDRCGPDALGPDVSLPAVWSGAGSDQRCDQSRATGREFLGQSKRLWS